MREDHGRERWSWKTFFGGVAVVAAGAATTAFVVASGGTAAVAIAGVMGVKTATTTAAALLSQLIPVLSGLQRVLAMALLLIQEGAIIDTQQGMIDIIIRVQEEPQEIIRHKQIV